MSDHMVTQTTSGRTSGDAAAERAAGTFGCEIIYDDPDRKSVFATINERV